MLSTIIFAVLLVAAVVFLIALIVNAIRLWVRKARKAESHPVLVKVKRSVICFLAAGALCVGFAFLTQAFASTPGIDGDNAVAELKRVELNGRREWISIRGNNRNNPVLLFLAGGPGGSQMAAVRHDLAALEEHFVVINWDQPGSGKSYGAAGGALTPNDYIDDGYALTKILCEEFGQEKIYLVGESWGSALGIFMIDRAPELYHAFIGTGQMVSFLDTELMDYELAMQIANDRGDSKTIATLEANGKPPYYGKDVTWKSAAYLQYLSDYMNANPAIQNGGYNTFRDLFSGEYGVWDKINYLRGVVATFNTVYPQLYDIDLREDYPAVEVPVYFFIGRHDVNAPVSLAKEYYDLLDAPEKELVWFEHSGHSPWINESGLFVSELLRVTGAE
ncbi:MAG TPA: alpha/beta hydrolase [Clostridiales bacterium]|nr:alpha/beta hydrolase [Clostridiales bacterium]